MNTHPIGILDSGIGGLTIWREIARLLPHEDTLFIADSKHCPYGGKSEEEIYRLSLRLVKYLVSQQVKCIVLACNTVTVTCIDRFRELFPQIPFIGTVPAIKIAAAVSKRQRIGVLSTMRTTESEYQHQLITDFAGNCAVVAIGTNDLVPLIERGEGSAEELGRVLDPICEKFCQENVDAIVLGCTHFPYLKEAIQKRVGEGVLLVDSGEAIARRVKVILSEKHLLAAQEHEAQYRFMTTGESGSVNVVSPQSPQLYQFLHEDC